MQSFFFCTFLARDLHEDGENECILASKHDSSSDFAFEKTSRNIRLICSILQVVRDSLPAAVGKGIDYHKRS